MSPATTAPGPRSEELTDPRGVVAAAADPKEDGTNPTSGKVKIEKELEKKRKKAEKQAKFEQKKATRAPAAAANASRTKEKKEKEKRAEADVLPLTSRTPRQERKSG